MLVWVQFEVFWDRTYIDRSSSYRFSSVQFEFFRTAPISIGHLSISSIQFEFVGLHLYRSVIVLLVWVWVSGVAPISICHLPTSLYLVWVETAPISICHCLVSLSLSFWVRTAPISIGHRLVSLGLSFRTAPISIGHCLVSLNLSLSFWGCTYIDRSSSMSVWVSRTAPILIGHSSCQLSWVLFNFESRLPSWVYLALSHTLSFIWVLFPCVNHSLSQSSLYCSLYHGPVLFITHTLLASSTSLASLTFLVCVLNLELIVLCV